MNSINANAIVNSHLEGDIAMRRGHALRSYFKRQSRRQVRQRLATELRVNMGHHLAEASEMMSMRAGDVDRNLGAVSTATIIAFPSQEQRAARSVLVVRKFARSRSSPFERQQVQVELLAA
jgi:hypothetical protein